MSVPGQNVAYLLRHGWKSEDFDKKYLFQKASRKPVALHEILWCSSSASIDLFRLIAVWGVANPKPRRHKDQAHPTPHILHVWVGVSSTSWYSSDWCESKVKMSAKVKRRAWTKSRKARAPVGAKKSIVSWPFLLLLASFLCSGGVRLMVIAGYRSDGTRYPSCQGKGWVGGAVTNNQGIHV